MMINHPDLNGSQVLSVRFHAKSLFPLYQVTLETKEGSQIQIAAKQVSSIEMAETEHESLHALEQTGAPVPKAYGYSLLSTSQNAILLMEFLTPSPQERSKSYDSLTENLLKIYYKEEKQYGWHRNNFIGSLVQKNKKHNRFSDFWWMERIFPQWELAKQRGYLTDADRKNLEKITVSCCEKWGLDHLKPRLVHGDLWSGNLLNGPAGVSYLIDPCVSYSNPEQDIAMLSLFGSALSFCEEEQIALKVGAGSGFRERTAFWQIYPLLVHVNLFAGGYIQQLRDSIRSYLSYF